MRNPQGADRLQSQPMENELSIAFIGAGQRAPATVTRAAAKVCAVGIVHVIDINDDAGRAGQGCGIAGTRLFGEPLGYAGRLFARATRNMQGVVAWRRQSLPVDAAVIRKSAAQRVRGTAGAVCK